MTAIILLLIGGVLFGLDAFGVSPVPLFPETLAKLLSLFIGVATMYMILRRDTYLPFLGKAVFPCGTLAEKAPHGADMVIRIRTHANANIIYWAAEESTSPDPVKNPWDAYNIYSNTGVARSDANGHATLKFRKPAQYKVGLFDTILPAHVHYRVCRESGGMVGPVVTVKL